MTPAELIREEWRKSQLVTQVIAFDCESDEEESDDEFVDFDMVVEAAVEEMELEAGRGGEDMERCATA